MPARPPIRASTKASARAGLRSDAAWRGRRRSRRRGEGPRGWRWRTRWPSGDRPWSPLATRASEGRRVELVIGVEGQHDVHGPGDLGGLLAAVEKVEKAGGVRAGGLPIRGSWPVRMRCHAATISGTRVMSRNALRRFAPSSLDRASGSPTAARNTAVRRASRGWQSRGSVRSRAAISGGSPRDCSRRAWKSRARPPSAIRRTRGGGSRLQSWPPPRDRRSRSRGSRGGRLAVDLADRRSRRDHILESAFHAWSMSVLLVSRAKVRLGC